MNHVRRCFRCHGTLFQVIYSFVLVFFCVAVNFCFNCTEESIEKCTCEWLMFGRIRVKTRKERKKNNRKLMQNVREWSWAVMIFLLIDERRENTVYPYRVFFRYLSDDVHIVIFEEKVLIIFFSFFGHRRLNWWLHIELRALFSFVQI